MPLLKKKNSNPDKDLKRLLRKHEDARADNADCAALLEQLMKQLSEVAADARAIRTQVVPTLKQNLAKTSGLSKKMTKKINAIENEIYKSLNLINLGDINIPIAPLQPEILKQEPLKLPSASPSYTSEVPERYFPLPPPSSSFLASPPQSFSTFKGTHPNLFTYVIMESGSVEKRMNQPACFPMSTRVKK